MPLYHVHCPSCGAHGTTHTAPDVPAEEALALIGQCLSCRRVTIEVPIGGQGCNEACTSMLEVAKTIDRTLGFDA